MQEYNVPQSFDKPARQPEGDLLEHGADIGFDVGELSRQKNIESALAAIDAATNPTMPEHVPSGQEIIHMWGKSVLALRKPESEMNIDIFDDGVTPAPYLKEASWKGFNEQSF